VTASTSHFAASNAPARVYVAATAIDDAISKRSQVGLVKSGSSWSPSVGSDSDVVGSTWRGQPMMQIGGADHSKLDLTQANAKLPLGVSCLHDLKLAAS
jgi:hypothetical protein